MHLNPRRIAAAALLVGLAAALSACLLSPGRFTSALDLRKDGRFTFSYTGEIRMLALSQLAQMNRSKPFAPECTDDDLKPRQCSASEIAGQKKAWDEEQVAAADRRKHEGEQMKALLGGIDPASPQAAEEFAGRLRRQAGWKSVVYKGDGLFTVDFALSGRIDHDFAFPTVERFALANAFVQLTRRADGTVRIDAPGFSPASTGTTPLAAMMGGAMAIDGDKDAANAMPVLEGSFTIITDGQVLANNTDEGPALDGLGQRLFWPVNLRTAAAPTALIRLANSRPE